MVSMGQWALLIPRVEEKRGALCGGGIVPPGAICPAFSSSAPCPHQMEPIIPGEDDVGVVQSPLDIQLLQGAEGEC